MKFKKMFAVAVALVAPIAAASPASAALVVSPATIGQRVFVATTGDVIASFVSASAVYENTLFIAGRTAAIFNNKTSAVGSTVNLGSFAAGTELVFRLNSVTDNIPASAYNFYTGPGSRNLDGVAHAAANTAAGITYVGFEDTLNGGDRDYNDLTFSFTNTAAAVPEPASWAMMILGIGMVGFAMRSAKRRSDVRFDMKIKRIAAGLPA